MARINIDADSALGFNGKATPASFVTPTSAAVLEAQIGHMDDLSKFSRYHSKAKSLVVFDEGAGEGFSAAKGSTLTTRQQLLNEIKDKLEDSKELREELADWSKEGGKGSRTLSRMSDRAARSLKNNATKVYNVAQKTIEEHEKAREAFTEDFSAAWEKLRESKTKAFAKIESTKVGAGGFATADEKKAAKELLAKNFEEAEDHLKGIKTKVMDIHEDTIKEASSLIQEVEEATGIKAPLKGAAGALEKNAASTAAKEENAVAKAAEAGGGSKLLPAAGVVAGAGLLYSGLTDENSKMNWRTGVGAVLGGYSAMKLLQSMKSAAGQAVTHMH